MPQRALNSRQLLERLVAFDTVSRHSNLALIDFVRDYLDGYGVASRLVPSPCGEKANLFASIGPDEVGGVVLSGHSDTVPVDGQSWSSDPFVLTEREEKLFARGSADMKGFIASALAAVPQFTTLELAKPIHLAFSYDEEIGCVGVRPMLAALENWELRPAHCIVGEPTSMRPVIAHKSKTDFFAEVRGRACHSSLAPAGVNAVHMMARLITKLETLAQEKADQGPFVEGFGPAHSTIHVGTIEGGTVLNIVPEHSRIEFEIRAVPGDIEGQNLLEMLRDYAARDLLPGMHAVDPETGIRFTERASYPGLNLDSESPTARLAAGCSGHGDFGKVSYGTEAGLFQGAGIPAVVCGPGDIAQAHRADEFIAISELAACDAFLEALPRELETL